MGAAQRTDPDHVHILLDGRLDDFPGEGVSDVDDLHAGISQFLGHGDNSPVMHVQTQLCQKHLDFLCHG